MTIWLCRFLFRHHKLTLLFLLALPSTFVLDDDPLLGCPVSVKSLVCPCNYQAIEAVLHTALGTVGESFAPPVLMEYRDDVEF